MPYGKGSEPGVRGLRRTLAAALRVANDRWGHRDEGGMTLIECAVAIALLVIVILPTTLFVIDSERSLSQSHLTAEANTLASQALSGLQAEAARNSLPNGFQSTTQAVDEVGGRKTLFTISTGWTTIQQGTNKTLCAAGTGGGPAQQIWLVTASVSWQDMHGAQPVVQTTEISPGDAGGLQQSAGELGVSLDSVGNTPFVGASVTGTLTGTWNTAIGPQPTVPTGEHITETGSSINSATGDFNGCIVFQDMDAEPGWSYTLSLAGNPTIVQAAEFSDSNPNGPFTEPITLQAGVPDIVTIELNLGTPFTIGYTQGPTGSCTTGLPLLKAPATTSEIPVTVNNGGLTTYTNNDWVAYNATGSQFTSLLLYPGFTSVTSMWAGAGPTSSQAAPCTVNAAAGSGLPQTVYLQLYDLKMTVAGSPSTLTATQLGGSGITYNLATGGTSETDIPLGQYSLADSTGSVTSGGTPAEVWVTEGGNCVSSAATPPTPCNSPISVVAP
jgi:hypothetical protein